MRWDELFADLEAQASALERAERSAEIDERTRGEIGALGVRDRLRAALGSSVRVQLAGPLALDAAPLRVGSDWMLLDEGGGREALVALAHLLGVRGLSRWSQTPRDESVVESRLGLRHALRGVARDRSPCRVHLVDGSVRDATLDRIGADFVEIASHAAGELRRRQDVRETELVPLAALVAVRRSG